MNSVLLLLSIIFVATLVAVYVVLALIIRFFAKQSQVTFIGKSLFISYFLTVATVILLPGLSGIWLALTYWEGAPIVVLAIALVIILVSILTRSFYSIVQRAWTIVPEMHEYIVEQFGKYIGEPLKEGPYLLFPYYSFVTIRSSVYMGQVTLPLYLDDTKKDEYGGDGDLDLQDCSTNLDAHIIIQACDSAKVTYKSDNPFQIIQLMADHTLRGFLRPYTLDQAMDLRVKEFTLWRIACGVQLWHEDSEDKSGPATTDNEKNKKYNKPKKVVPSQEVTEADYQNSSFYKEVESIGYRVLTFVIGDFDLPPEVVAERERVFTANKTLEVKKIEVQIAEEEKNIAMTRATATSEVEKILGGGEGERIKTLAAGAGVTPSEALAFLVAKKKWDAVGKEGTNILLNEGGSDGLAGLGAQLGIGFRFGNIGGQNAAAPALETEAPTPEDKDSGKPEDKEKKK